MRVFVCVLSSDVVMCCICRVWLLLNVFVWSVCRFACVVVWCYVFVVLFMLCVVCVRAVLV